MAGIGPPPKPDDRRQRRNSRPGTLIPFTPGAVVKAPPMPVGLLVVTQGLWRAFWKSPLAGTVELNTDIAAITRLFSLYDERERAFRAYRRKRLMKGSQGRSVLNPMARAMSVFDAEIRQLEDRLGMTPRARLQLGITLGAAAKTLHELNRILEEDHDDSNDDEDPRQQ